MTEDQSSVETTPADIPSIAPTPRRKVLHFAIVALGAAVVWLVTWLAVGSTIGLGMWTLSLIIPSACVVLFALILLRQEQKWIIPVREMNRLLPLIRQNEIPIDAIRQVDGGLKLLAIQVEALLREIRQQKAHLAELENETRQRVANRTDALERKIGSLKHQASRDALTGLFNRRMLDQFLPETIERCREEKSNVALLMIDVDYFKVLNDTLGHPAGDALLRNIGQIIRSTIRENDAAFRCGGDEFVAVLPGCSQENAEALAARLNSLVMALTKPFRISHQPQLSIGVASLNQLCEQTTEGLIEEADKRLYEIKSRRKALSRTAPPPRGAIARAG